jgi:formylglycine-generating enzyme required for sulfatase activity
MGSDPHAAFPPAADEAPRHAVEVAPFRLGRTPVTNAQYRRFVEETGHRAPGSWPDGCVPAGQDDVPVTYVSWHDAAAFCAWAGGRLPTEAEWEAAAGGDGRLWPWGDVPPTTAEAVFAQGIGGPGPVGRHPVGAAPCGALDLAGNVGEWVSSAHRPYPYDGAEGREDRASGEPRVVRGGSYIHEAGAIRSSSRLAFLPGAIDTYVGFRLAADPGAPCDAVELVDVAAGHVVIGRDPVAQGGPALPDEAPQGEVDVPAFALTRTPVTNAQYAAFVRATGHRTPLHWAGADPPPGSDACPVTYVDHADATAFCAWAGGRLPTEAEWEKAARGPDGRLHPWGGSDPEDDELVTLRHKAVFGRGVQDGAPAEVGSCPEGASPYGLLDMAGNVWEWVSSAYAPYPYDAGDGREEPAAPGERALRGGSYASPAGHLRCAARSRSYPTRLAPHIGFRVARDA